MHHSLSVAAFSGRNNLPSSQNHQENYLCNIYIELKIKNTVQNALITFAHYINDDLTLSKVNLWHSLFLLLLQTVTISKVSQTLSICLLEGRCLSLKGVNSERCHSEVPFGTG